MSTITGFNIIGFVKDIFPLKHNDFVYSSEKMNGFYELRVHPIKRDWEAFFFALKKDEAALCTNGQLNNLDLNIQFEPNASHSIQLAGPIVKDDYVYWTSQNIATSNIGFNIYCSRPPSLINFGDLKERDLQFCLYLKIDGNEEEKCLNSERDFSPSQEPRGTHIQNKQYIPLNS